MNKSQNYHDDVIEEEPSIEEKLLLSHMNSEDLYPEENIQNLELEEEEKEKFQEDPNVNKKIHARKSSKLERTSVNGHKNLEDSLEIQKEEISVSNSVSFIKKEPEKPLKIRNERVDIPRRDKNLSRNNNNINNSVNISNDRYSQHENINNTDDDELKETRVMLKKNKSTFIVAESNPYNTGKKNKEKQKKINRSPKIERERERDRHEIAEYESKDLDEKEVSPNDLKLHNNFEGKSSINSINNMVNNHAYSDGNSFFNPGNSMKNLPIVHSSMQYQPNAYNQFIPSIMNQFPNHHMENNMNPLMNSGYLMPNNNNPFLQGNIHNPFQYNQFGYNPYQNQIPINPNHHHYMNQNSQQPFNLNMQHIQNTGPHVPNSGISSQEFMQLKVNITNLESENLALKQKVNELNKLQSLNKSKEKEHSELFKENYQLKLMIDNIEADNRALLQEIEEMKNNNYENEKLDEIEKNYNMIIKSKDELLKKNKEEIDKLKINIDNLKKENTKLKNGNQNFENEKSSLKEKMTELEEERETLNKKLQAEGINFSNLREDFDNLVKKYQALKSQNDYTQNLLEEFKSDNYYLKKEIEHLTRKSQNNPQSKINQSLNSDTKTEKSNGGSQSKLDESTFITEASDTSQSNRLKVKNEEMNKNKEINLEINKIQQKIAQLVVEKGKYENDLFKLPDKPRTMNVIQKQQALEQKLQGVEMEINRHKTKVREMKNQLNIK